MQRIRTGAGKDIGIGCATGIGARVGNRSLIAAKRLAYLQHAAADSAELSVLNLVSGERRHIAATHLANEAFPRGSLLAWTPDGDSIVVPDRPNPQADAGLFAISVARGSSQRLTSPPPTWRDVCPRISPNGRMLAFLRERQPSEVNLCYGSLRNGRVTKTTCLSLPQKRIYGFTFGPDSNTLYASLAEVGLQGHLWKISLDSPRHAVQLLLSEATSFEPTYSAGTLLCRAGGIRVALTKYQVSKTSAVHQQILAYSNVIEIYAKFSPDGSRLAFISNRSGAYDVWVVDAADQGDPRRVSFLSGQTAGGILWSSDAGEIAWSEMVGGKAGVYVVGPKGGTPHRFDLQEPPSYLPRGWSTDKTRLYVETGRSTKTTTLVELDLTTGKEKPVITGPGTATLGIVPDATALFKLNAGELRSVDPRTGQQLVLARGNWAEFDPEGTRLLLEKPGEPGRATEFDFFSYGDRRLVGIGAFPCDGPGATASPDGKTFICSASQVNTELKYTVVH